MNPAKENILLRREIGALRALLERQPLEYTVRWLKLSFLTLRRLGWGEKNGLWSFSPPLTSWPRKSRATIPGRMRRMPSWSGTSACCRCRWRC